MTTVVAAREQTRARHPDADGYVERDGVRIFWEPYGTREPAEADGAARAARLIAELLEGRR